MRLSPVQFAVRLTWGVGLLFVPAVQEKLCANPPKTAPETNVAQPLANSREQSPKSREKRPLTLAALAPDMTPPRRSDQWRLSTAARVRPLLVAASSDVSGDDDRLVGAYGPVAPCRHILPRIPESDRTPTMVVSLTSVIRYVFTSSILETGPPLV